MTSELRFSRHAIDSTDEAMDMTFSMRIPHDLRILAGRKARLMGLSLSEYTRHLLWRAVDEDTLPDGEEAKVLRKGDVA